MPRSGAPAWARLVRSRAVDPRQLRGCALDTKTCFSVLRSANSDAGAKSSKVRSQKARSRLWAGRAWPIRESKWLFAFLCCLGKLLQTDTSVPPSAAFFFIYHKNISRPALLRSRPWRSTRVAHRTSNLEKDPAVSSLAQGVPQRYIKQHEETSRLPTLRLRKIRRNKYHSAPSETLPRRSSVVGGSGPDRMRM